MIKFYAYKGCSSCRTAEKFLKDQEIPYTFIDIATAPPSPKELIVLVKKSGLELKKFLNTSGEVYRELGLKDKLASMSEVQIINLLAGNGRLIKRPLITDDTRVTVGFKDDAEKVWSTKKR